MEWARVPMRGSHDFFLGIPSRDPDGESPSLLEGAPRRSFTRTGNQGRRARVEVRQGSRFGEGLLPLERVATRPVPSRQAFFLGRDGPPAIENSPKFQGDGGGDARSRRTAARGERIRAQKGEITDHHGVSSRCSRAGIASVARFPP